MPCLIALYNTRFSIALNSCLLGYELWTSVCIHQSDETIANNEVSKQLWNWKFQGIAGLQKDVILKVLKSQPYRNHTTLK
jgi:hypothetical protein